MDHETAAADIVELRRKYTQFVKLADGGTRSTAFYLEIRNASDALVCLLDEVDHAEDGSWDALAEAYAVLLRRVAG